MKSNKLSITINKPIKVVFEFTVSADNTPRWISHLDVEEASDFPPKVGTIYRNKAIDGQWSNYVVSDVDTNKIFELRAADGNYHVRYTYAEKDGKTTLTYFEWVNQGELDEPFTQNVLEKLKQVIETN